VVDEIATHVGATAKLSSQKSQAVPIRAELIGGNTCTAAGLLVRGSSPVLALCRDLIAAGHDSAAPFDAWRGDVLAVRVASLAAGAQLTVEESAHGPVFRNFRKAPRSAVPAPRVAANEAPATHPAEDAADTAGGP
jgi:hypothetical protein